MKTGTKVVIGIVGAVAVLTIVGVVVLKNIVVTTDEEGSTTINKK